MSIRPARTWPGATEVVASHLNVAMAVPVFWVVPTTRPASFVIVRRSGGGGGAVLDTPQVIVECWNGDRASNPRDAERLATSVVRALLDMPTLESSVTRVAIEGQAFLTDPPTGCARVMISARIWLKPEPEAS